jgi:hypothetical protein
LRDSVRWARPGRAWMSRSVAANKISADLKRFSAGCDYACEPSTGPEPGSVSKDSTMKTQHNMHRNLPGHLALLGLVGALVVPSVSAAASLVPGVPAPVAASDDDNDCAPAVVALQIDVSTGEVYIVNDVGGLTLTDNQITVHFGSQTSVIVDIEYSSGDFEVEISPAGGSTVVRSTRGGALRYKISDKISEYVFSSTELAGMSAMMNMTPVVPDIIILPKKDCPPST